MLSKCTDQAATCTLYSALMDAIPVPHSSGLSFVNGIMKHTRPVTLTWYSAPIVARKNVKNTLKRCEPERFSAADGDRISHLSVGVHHIFSEFFI